MASNNQIKITMSSLIQVICSHSNQSKCSHNAQTVVTTSLVYRNIQSENVYGKMDTTTNHANEDRAFNHSFSFSDFPAIVDILLYRQTTFNYMPMRDSRRRHDIWPSWPLVCSKYIHTPVPIQQSIVDVSVSEQQWFEELSREVSHIWIMIC